MKKVLKSFLIIFMFMFLINSVDALDINKYNNLYLNVLEAQAEDTSGGGSNGENRNDLELNTDNKTCAELLGKNMTNLIHAGIRIFQIVAAIVALLRGMTLLIPPIISKDSDALKKAESELIILAIVFKPIVRVLGSILSWDVSCII